MGGLLSCLGRLRLHLRYPFLFIKDGVKVCKGLLSAYGRPRHGFSPPLPLLLQLHLDSIANNRMPLAMIAVRCC